MENSLSLLPLTSSSSSSSSLASEEDIKRKEFEKFLQSLPKTKGWFSDTGLTLYQDFWCPTSILKNVISFQNNFHAHDNDIILTSKPKSGTTWLKSLIFSIVNRNRFTLSNTPLLTTNPHELVPFCEFNLYANKENPDFSVMSSPRLFSTHLPYPSLPESIKESKCRTVYVCRNPFDIVVSFWHFATEGYPQRRSQWTLEEFVENFCDGKIGFGPYWNHALGYWNESLKKPKKVLFLKYEDLKEDTNYHMKILAEFLGFPFSSVEEKEGVIDDISKLCSLSFLKDLEVNKNGKFMPSFENKYYFRKGEVGDWVNQLSPSMVDRLDKMLQEKLKDSGLKFKLSS